MPPRGQRIQYIALHSDQAVESLELAPQGLYFLHARGSLARLLDVGRAIPAPRKEEHSLVDTSPFFGYHLGKMLRRLLSFREWGILLVLVAEVLLFAFLLHRPERTNPMLSPDNLLALARDTAVLALAAIGACVVIISGGIDLAVGSEIALTCVVTA